MRALNPSRVLVPIDFSRASSLALRQAMLLVDDPDDLYTVHVVPPRGLRVWVRPEDEGDTVVEAFFDQWLRDFGTPLSNRLVVHGVPGETIARVAATIGATLVVIPAHSGLPRPTLGSTAERVARLAPCDVLVQRTTWPETHDAPLPVPMLEPGRVESALVALDGTPDSLLALEVAAGLVRDPSDLTVLHVLVEVAYESTWIWPERMERERRVYARELHGRDLLDRGLGEATLSIATGRPQRRLADLAAELAPEVVVMGAVGHSLDPRVGLGAVASRALSRVERSVLLVRGPRLPWS